MVIVSSGAIGVALQEMGLPRRPKHLPQVQALAAIGQCRLMGLWDQLFSRIGQTVAQILLTRNDIADRTQYLNAQNTFVALLDMGVIPIVNENDTLSVSEIKFGDNDTLSAITAGMVHADYLFLMTDVDCLYDKNPRTNPDAKAIEVVENIADLEADVSSAGSALGTGGMSTKIVAARLATAAGVTTIITRSSKPGNITGIVSFIEAQKTHRRASVAAANGGTTTPLTEEKADVEATAQSILPDAPLHTRFLPSAHPVRDRQFWILHGLKPHGTVFIDEGAAQALKDKAGLLPVGIVDVEGIFAQQDCVRIVEVHRRPHPMELAEALGQTRVESPKAHWSPKHGPVRSISSTDVKASPLLSPLVTGEHAESPFFESRSAKEIGRALVNYSSTEIRLIAGLKSTEIAGVLGYADSEYVAVRENVAMLGAGLPSRPETPIQATRRNVGGGLVSYVEG